MNVLIVSSTSKSRGFNRPYQSVEVVAFFLVHYQSSPLVTSLSGLLATSLAKNLCHTFIKPTMLLLSICNLEDSSDSIGAFCFYNIDHAVWNRHFS